MSNNWLQRLKFDPLPPLLSSGNEALGYFVRRDLLGEDAGPVQRLWPLPGAQKILKKQRPDGSCPRPGVNKHPAINPDLIETWRYLRILVEQYGFTHEHPQARQAAEYLFSCQAEEGDFRGMIANQYATYYTGAILATLIQAGCVDDPRIDKVFQWLLEMRQSDGGWTIPLITHKLDRKIQYFLTSQVAEPLQPDHSRPFSHNATGMILCAFAVHPGRKNSEAARTAASQYKSRFFQADVYTSYQSAGYWVRFEYPFWWNSLVSGLDSLSRMGFSKEDPSIAQALGWLVDHQETSGLWKTSYMKPDEQEKDNSKVREMKLWVSLAICRVFARLFGGEF